MNLSPEQIVGLACELGPAHALRFATFMDTLDGLAERDRKLVASAWLGLQEIESGPEYDDVLRAVEELRDRMKRPSVLETVLKAIIDRYPQRKMMRPHVKRARELLKLPAAGTGSVGPDAGTDPGGHGD